MRIAQIPQPIEQCEQAPQVLVARSPISLSTFLIGETGYRSSWNVRGPVRTLNYSNGIFATLALQREKATIKPSGRRKRANESNKQISNNGSHRRLDRGKRNRRASR
jgi:hypothetical protein